MPIKRTLYIIVSV